MMPFRTICVLFHLIQEYGMDSPEGISLSGVNGIQ